TCSQAISTQPTERPLLQDFTLTLAPGRTLGVLGRTGSGKTTLTRLLLRLYDPQAGTVELNGIDLRQLTRAALRRHVGIVTQDVQLFHASVRDNLTFFDARLADAAIEEALVTVGLGDWLQALPAGLDTMLAAGGSGLSAGEAQLLAFARLLLRDPGVVLLDEASSRLDPHSERRLDQALNNLLFGGQDAGTQNKRTAMIIAHRLTTLQKVDDLLILEAGQIQEYGPRAQLAADPTSRFAQLLRTGNALNEVII
ncbi:MAG: ABC transporter ATP-binding protein, partial [Caldilineaceae bacterium]|nr:ABC transporter ATP-binding protein [Caldilineaceae bacterium]